MMRTLLCLALSGLLTACVTQTTVETRVPTEAAKSDPRKRAQVHTQLGAAYYGERRLAVALEEARMALKDDPTFAPAYNLLGLIYMDLGEDVEARDAFQKGMTLDGADSDLLNNFGWFECQRGDVNRGLQLFAQVQKDGLYPTPEKPLLNQGVCQRKIGKTQEAEESFRRAVLYKPDLAPALFGLAELAFARGALKESQGYINRYQRVTQAGPDALLLGARVALGLNDNAQASQYLDQLKRRYPESREARAAQELR